MPAVTLPPPADLPRSESIAIPIGAPESYDALRLLREAIDQQTLTADGSGTVMRLFVSELDHRLLYDQALSVTLELLNLTAGMLFLYDDRRRIATLRAHHGLPESAAEHFRVCRVSDDADDLLSRCILGRRMLTLSAAQPEALAEAAEALGMENLSALAARPIMLGKEMFGVLLVCARRGQWALIGQNLARFRALCDSLAVAIGHERLYTRKLEEVTTELVSVLSHEFRTPLTSILGYAEVLVDGDAGELSEEQQTYLKIIETSARRLQRQVESLLTLSRIQEGTLAFKREPIRVGEAVANVLAVLGPRMDMYQLSLHTHIPDDLPRVSADARALDQILFHLLDNAFKFTPEGGSIYLRASRQGPMVHFSVMNTGASIPQEEQEALFNPFYRAQAAVRDAAQGTGLGLAVVRALVEQHGGRIWVESTAEASTTFYFTLPVDEDEEARTRGGGSIHG
jgi:signal transduction histidine kinase